LTDKTRQRDWLGVSNRRVYLISCEAAGLATVESHEVTRSDAKITERNTYGHDPRRTKG